MLIRLIYLSVNYGIIIPLIKNQKLKIYIKLVIIKKVLLNYVINTKLLIPIITQTK